MGKTLTLIFFLTCILLSMSFSNSNAQTLLKGKVTDIETKEPLIGAVLILEDTKISTITNAVGEYSLIVPANPKLQYQLLEVKYVGYAGTDDFIPVTTEDSLVTVVKDFQLKFNSVVLEDAIVTANKVEQELQSVPIAASVVDAGILVRRTVSTSEEALESVPNLVMTSHLPHQPTISIRGLATNFANGGVENEVGLYIDDVYQSRAFAFNSVLMDISRLEVLRGPQGTLFGKNAIGGVIHVISEQPEMSNSSAVELSAGNFAFVQVRAKTNLVLSKDKLALRLVGAYKKRDGWLREENSLINKQNGVDFFGGRASLLYTPSDKLKITFRGNYGQDNKAEFSVDYNTPTFGDRLDVSDIQDKNGQNRIIHQDAEGISFKRKTGGGSAKAEIQLNDKLTLTSITAYGSSTTTNLRDFDSTPIDAAIFTRSVGMHTFSQELRISTPRENQKISFVGGLYYLNERITNEDSIAFHADFQPVYDIILSSTVFPDGTYIPTYEEAITNGSINNSQSYAAFGSAAVEVTERVRVNGGIRLTVEDRKLDYWQTMQQLTPESPGWASAFAVNFGSRKEPMQYEINGSDGFAVSGNIGMDFQTTDKILLYVSLSRGFKGAGFNIAYNRFPRDEDFTFMPEFLNSYEFGLKAKFNRRFRWNTAAFVTDYRNKQEAVAVGPGVFIYNAESAQGIGLESEFTGIWASGFRTDIAMSAMRLNYFSFPVFDLMGNQTDNLGGNQLFKSPSFTFKFSPEYKFDLGKDLEILLKADYNFTGKIYNDIFNTEVLAKEPAGLLNGRIGFSTQEGKYSLAIWGKNLTNETFIVHAWEFVHGQHLSVNPPRTLGVELRVNFY